MCVSTYVGLVDDYLLFFFVVGHVCSFLTECSIISILSGKPILRFPSLIRASMGQDLEPPKPTHVWMFSCHGRKKHGELGSTALILYDHAASISDYMTIHIYSDIMQTT
jgi:hypothetical protein